MLLNLKLNNCGIKQTLITTIICASFLVKILHGDTDFFLFAQQWSPTVCIDVSKMIVCQMPPGVDCWTIHGLWPGSLKQPSPRFCHTNSSFDLEKIQHLVPDLEKEWPSFFVERKESNFWKYEWKKHGTCAVVLSSLNSQELYFTKTLELKKQYDLLKILKENDIFPSTEKYYMHTPEKGVKGAKVW
ncbi:ribonuclease Oy-like isoform X4 [Limulus polyphemus]|uniref:Ribonuclease Oy-like isoform X4 n=1 Tax=Limulus polyphemus TaxID=6850 RepID=A0ABM1SJ20_LIMPO|nr:ribonuclease Oy-like isoform X4 [Limulus polyphemus]